MKHRIRTLSSLARIQDERMKSQASALSILQQQAGDLSREHAALERKRMSEGGIDLVEAMPYKGDFLRSVRRENERLHHEMAEVDRRIAEQRSEVLSAYRELRSTEHLQGTLRERFRKEMDIAEQKALDEAAMIAFSRSK